MATLSLTHDPHLAGVQSETLWLKDIAAYQLIWRSGFTCVNPSPEKNTKNMLKKHAMQLNHVESMQSKSIQAINLHYVRISSNIMDWPQKCDLHWCLLNTTTWEFYFQLNTYHHHTKNKQKPCQNAPQTTWAHLQTRKKHPSFSTVCYHTSLKKWHQKILKMTPWCCLSTSLLGIHQN